MSGAMRDKGYKRPTARSRELRASPTDAERLLWSALSARKVGGARFNTQFPIGPFICDFVSRGRKLAIEVDGGQHALAERADAARTRYIGCRGYRVIRFWNHEVLGNLDGVVAEIERVLADMPSPNPSRRREGNQAAPGSTSREQDDRSATEPPSRSREGLGVGLSGTGEP